MHDILIKAMEVIGTLIVAFGTIWYKSKKDRELKEKGNDITENYIRLNTVQPILDNIRYRTGAFRVMEWMASNGDTSIGGQSLKKLSISCESNSIDVKDMARDFQLIPIQVFSKRIEKLATSTDDWTITYADEELDYLSELIHSYGIQTSYLFKILSQYGQWTGILCVAFTEHEKKLSEAEVAFCKIQAAKLGTIK